MDEYSWETIGSSNTAESYDEDGDYSEEYSSPLFDSYDNEDDEDQ